MHSTIGHFIDGEQVIDQSPTQEVFNPALGSVIRQVALANSTTVDAAVSAASRAFPGWSRTPPAKRARVFFRYRNLLEEHADEVCRLITEEHGKVLSDARGELERAIENVEYACAVPELLKGEHSKNVGPAIDSWSELQPLGVVAGITPFNFPAMVPLWMWPLAIACGNTFVLKPSEKTPSAALFLAQLATQAGLPPGVLNVVNGAQSAVEALVHHPQVQAISFVGSTPVAESLYARASAQHKRVQALGGAKNHAVVMPDADLEHVVSTLMGAAYGSCGERCMAVPVVVAIGDAVADQLRARLATAVRSLKIGPGSDISNDMGPLVSREHRAKVLSYIEQGIEQGAELLVDGRQYQVPESPQGYFLGGTLFDQVQTDMSIYREEIFGPVLCIVRVESLKAAIHLINAHEYGNGTCIFTRDGEAARQFTDEIQVGMVGVNVPLPVPVAYHSFGGWKRSLFGDLSAYGPDGVRFYTRRKTVTQRWPSPSKTEAINFSFPGHH